jgi:non-canonical (house-cleaning) NTP pyrophosphatase
MKSNHMFKFAIGTNSGYKVNAVKSVLGELDIDSEVFPLKVNSGVSDQPRTDNEGNLFSEQSSTLELPRLLAEGLKNDVDVNSQLKELRELIPDDHMSRKYWLFITKRRIIQECVGNVLLRWHFDKLLYR